MTRFYAILLFAFTLALGRPAQAQHGDPHRADSADASHTHESADMPLQAPGHAIFGTVQEAIQALEADPETDWSAVDVEALRQHLIDMHHAALNVAVDEQAAIDNGVRLVIRPTTDEAAGALQRVLSAHPTMLQQETGWQMDVTPDNNRFILHVTDPSGTEADKIRGLGYIGLLAYGPHHQHHHWMMVRDAAPHEH